MKDTSTPTPGPSPQGGGEGAPQTYLSPVGKRFAVRALEESDEALIADFLEHADPDDVRLRFFASMRTFDHKFLWPLVHYDHKQAVAFLAIDPDDGRAAGVSRLHCDVLRTFGEFAIFVRADLKRHGLGRHLMALLIDWARAGAIPLIRGEILAENWPMRALCLRLGFTLKAAHDDPGLKIAELDVPQCRRGRSAAESRDSGRQI